MHADLHKNSLYIAFVMNLIFSKIQPSQNLGKRQMTLTYHFNQQLFDLSTVVTIVIFFYQNMPSSSTVYRIPEACILLF